MAKHNPTEYQVVIKGVTRTLDTLTREELQSELMKSIDCLESVELRARFTTDRIDEWRDDRPHQKWEKPLRKKKA